MQVKIIEGANVADLEKKANDFLHGRARLAVQVFPHGSGLNMLVYLPDNEAPAPKEKPAKVAAAAAPKKAAAKKSADTKKPV